MRNIFIASILALSALGLGGCAKNYADNFVGTYDVTVKASVGGIPIPDQTTTATIELDGDEGDVKCTIVGVTVEGTASSLGLALDPVTYSSTSNIMGSDIQFEVTFENGEIIPPLNEAGKTSWTSAMKGFYTTPNNTTQIDETVIFMATKK